MAPHALAAGAFGASAPQSPPPIYLQPGALQTSQSGDQQVYAIGDSLTAGIGDILPGYFPGWGVGVWGRNGRPLAEGMNVLARTIIPPDGSIILAMGLGTNDPPWDGAALAAAVRESLRRVGPDGCVVWATIFRPAQSGVTYHAENAMLRRMADREPRLRIADWSASLHRHPVALDRTGVHPKTLAGWIRRAQIVASAVRSC